MFLSEVLQQVGTWTINIEESMLFRKQRVNYPDGFENHFETKLRKMGDSRFAFNQYAEYFNIIYYAGSPTAIKHYYETDNDFDEVKVYDNPDMENKPILTLEMLGYTENRLLVFVKEEALYMVLDFDPNPAHLPKGYLVED